MNARDLGHAWQVGPDTRHAEVSVLQGKAEILAELDGRWHVLADVRLQHIVDHVSGELQGKRQRYARKVFGARDQLYNLCTYLRFGRFRNYYAKLV